MESGESIPAHTERVSIEELRELQEAFMSISAARQLLDSVPNLAVVLSETRQILAVNSALMRRFGIDRPEQLVGMRPGDLVQCMFANDTPDGCGTGEPCASCKMNQTVLDSMRKKKTVAQRCRIMTQVGANTDSLDLHVEASPFALGDRYVYVVDMQEMKAD